MHYSPLRYPGGKGKLEPFMELMIKKMGHVGGTYIEPFAGGAGIAIGLLEKEAVSNVVINDYDKGIYSVWRAMLTETDAFIDKVMTIPLTIEEWQKQRDIYMTRNKQYSFDLGFATFYMNRTNRSGIIKGGVIGGVNQTGKWNLGVRFKRKELVKRIETVVKHKKTIHLYNKDAESFICNYLPQYENNALVFFDPPYYKKGKQLYTNYFEYKDHVRIEELIKEKVNCDWIITYDDVPEIADIYDSYQLYRYDLNYSVANKRKASEIIVFSDSTMVPSVEELNDRDITINLRDY